MNFQREAAFEHADSKTVVAMPQPNGTIYTFGRDVNILWRHGILQVGVLMCSCSGHHVKCNVWAGASRAAEGGGADLHHSLGLGPSDRGVNRGTIVDICYG